MLLNLASGHQEHCARFEKMKQLEELLEAGAWGPRTPHLLLHKYCQEHYKNRPASATKVQKKQVSLHLSILFSFCLMDSGLIIFITLDNER